MEKNTMIKLDVFTNTGGMCMTGRLLGLIKGDDLFPLLNNRTFQRKIFSKGTLSILEVAKAIDDRDRSVDVRLIAVVKEIENKVVSQRTLFISDKLDFVSKLSDSAEIAINGQEDSYIFVEEIEGKCNKNE